MNNSNYSLRFPRTYREATGTEAHFEDGIDWDRIVGIVGAIALAFVIGMIVGAA